MEALGGAASVIGVVSLAIELCKELRKVQEFWQSVREAPHQIAHIATEINLFITWLAVIANNYQRQGFDHMNPNHVAATDTLKLCLATVQDMNQGVEDLESRLPTSLLSRRWASVKFVFRKDKRETLMQQIERMKSLLVIVQTCYIGEVQEAGFRSLSATLKPRYSAPQTTGNIRPLNMSATAPTNENPVIVTQGMQPTLRSPVESVLLEPKPPLQALRPSQRSRTRQEERAYNFGFATLKFVGTEKESVVVEDSGNNRSIKARRTRYELRLAQWLLTRGFSWQTFGIYDSWQYTFRTFRYIPEDALIVSFCIEGDVANVQRMFEKGLASPFDRVRYEDEDWSLLHFSIANCNVQVCKFLIQCGLGHGTASAMSTDPILSIIGACREVSNPAAHIDILRLMVKEGQYDPMESASYTSVMHSFGGSLTAYQWLLDQEEFIIDFEQPRPWDSQTIAGALIGSQNLDSSSFLKAVMAHESGVTDLGEIRFLAEEDLWLPHMAVWDLARAGMADVVDFPSRVKVLWDAGFDFHTSRLHNRFGTTLDFLFSISFIITIDVPLGHKVEREYIPVPPLMSAEDVLEYDRLQDIPHVKDRPRTPKSLWHTWWPKRHPGVELSMLEVAQRHLDAWMEVLLEAGLDIAEYGQREERLHPEGLFYDRFGVARVHFEYGEHVGGCRVHVTEIWAFDPDKDYGTAATCAEPAKMPCSWDFEDT